MTTDPETLNARVHQLRDIARQIARESGMDTTTGPHSWATRWIARPAPMEVLWLMLDTPQEGHAVLTVGHYRRGESTCFLDTSTERLMIHGEPSESLRTLVIEAIEIHQGLRSPKPKPAPAPEPAPKKPTPEPKPPPKKARKRKKQPRGAVHATLRPNPSRYYRKPRRQVLPIPKAKQKKGQHTTRIDPYYWTAEWHALSHEVVERDGYICRYCDKHGTQADHVIPRKKGGSDTLDNLVCACADCNRIAGNPRSAPSIPSAAGSGSAASSEGDPAMTVTYTFVFIRDGQLVTEDHTFVLDDISHYEYLCRVIVPRADPGTDIYCHETRSDLRHSWAIR